ncbi:MAG TPA: hypothetical protein VL096_11355 [Pirellulaceae bacterium]|nr:hypothetical protein [Pirellulaceae bacterium]
MASSDNRPDSSLAGSAAAPSATTQQVVSLLLVIHLFCVFVALSTYSALSGYMRPSALQERLLQLLAPYTRTIDLAPGLAPYHLSHYNASTGASEIDDDFYLEIEVTHDDGSVERRSLNEFGSAFPDAQQRFRAFAADMVFYQSREGAGAIEFGEFARAAAGFALRKMDAEVGVLRLKRHMSQPRLLGDLEEGFPADPHAERYILTLYEADILLADGETQLIRREARGVVAPVISTPSSPAGK